MVPVRWRYRFTLWTGMVHRNSPTALCSSTFTRRDILCRRTSCVDCSKNSSAATSEPSTKEDHGYRRNKQRKKMTVRKWKHVSARTVRIVFYSLHSHDFSRTLCGRLLYSSVIHCLYLCFYYISAIQLVNKVVYTFTSMILKRDF